MRCAKVRIKRPHQGVADMLHWSIYLFIPLALLLVAGVLFLGLFNFASGGSPQRSQRLMQLRVLFQFLAIILVMITIFAMGMGR